MHVMYLILSIVYQQQLIVWIWNQSLKSISDLDEPFTTPLSDYAVANVETRVSTPRIGEGVWPTVLLDASI